MRSHFTLKVTCAKGFTLIELAVVIAILGIMMAIAIPSAVNYYNHYYQRVCSENRTAILQEYRAHNAIENDCALSDVLAGTCESFNLDYKLYACPQDGVYTTDNNGGITCSKHGK